MIKLQLKNKLISKFLITHRLKKITLNFYIKFTIEENNYFHNTYIIQKMHCMQTWNIYKIIQTNENEMIYKIIKYSLTIIISNTYRNEMLIMQHFLMFHLKQALYKTCNFQTTKYKKRWNTLSNTSNNKTTYITVKERAAGS